VILCSSREVVEKGRDDCVGLSSCLLQHAETEEVHLNGGGILNALNR
jgi:hypothetical protein